ncbi:MAG: hypothetical protein ABW068_08490 [Candidatus Thiodiazotropha sp.]
MEAMQRIDGHAVLGIGLGLGSHGLEIVDDLGSAVFPQGNQA